MMMQASDPGPTDTHGWNDLRCFPSQGESDCIQAEGVTNDKIPKDFTTYGIQAINGEIWVTFIPQDKAHGGFVDVFATDGTLLRHDASMDRMNAPAGEALKLQRPLSDNSLKIVARGDKKDEGGLAA